MALLSGPANDPSSPDPQVDEYKRLVVDIMKSDAFNTLNAFLNGALGQLFLNPEIQTSSSLSTIELHADSSNATIEAINQNGTNKHVYVLVPEDGAGQAVELKPTNETGSDPASQAAISGDDSTKQNISIPETDDIDSAANTAEMLEEDGEGGSVFDDDLGKDSIGPNQTEPGIRSLSIYPHLYLHLSIYPIHPSIYLYLSHKSINTYKDLQKRENYSLMYYFMVESNDMSRIIF